MVFTGCKDEKSVDSLEVKQPEAVDETFKVTLGLVVKKDDTFSLFYTEDGTINFKDEPVWLVVKGSDAEQQITYTLPDEVFPTELRFDFGLNKEQEDITLRSVTLEYKGNKRTIAGAELGNFFRADDTRCTFDPQSGLIKGIEKNGVKQSPSLYPHEANLKPEIEKLAK